MLKEDTMAQGSPGYGIPNLKMLKTWVNRPRAEDGAFWALNLMKYRPVADYGTDGRDGAVISGRKADDRYAPLVLGQVGAEPIWDRVAIVRYPSSLSFMEMQQRKDFQDRHVHKEAGMDFTIVMACLPDPTRPPVSSPDGTVVLRVARLPIGRHLPDLVGATRVATFDVEGVIIGDERTWSRVTFDVAPKAINEGSLLADHREAEEIFAMTLDTPVIEDLEASIRTAAGGRR
jgi:hypothetical protein